MLNRLSILIFLLALAYFVMGKLALFLAIPPGYATAIWPAAGVALAALLIKGYRLWPGVLLGSFLVNIGPLPDTSEPLAEMASGLVVPFIIASGAALQAVFGAWLVRRYIGLNITLDSVREVLRFIIFACGIACTVAASIGTAALVIAGLLPTENFLFNWLTWWVGDGLGVMTFTVLMLVCFGEPRDIWRSRRRILPLIMGGVSVVVVTLYIFGSRWELSRQQAEFRQYSEQVFSRAQAIINAHIENLYALGAFFEVSSDVTVLEFDAFVDGFLKRNTGFQAMAWVQHVREDKRQLVESQMSAEQGLPVVFTRRSDEQGLVPQLSHDEYAVIRYIEPLAQNVTAVGYDINSNALVRQALSRALTSDEPATTGPLPLVQGRSNDLGLVVYLPASVRGLARGEGALLGYVAAVFRIQDLMGLLLSPDSLRHISASVSAQEGSTFYASSKEPLGQALFSESAILDFADSKWTFKLDADQQYLAGGRSMVPWGMLAGGMLFTGLLGMTFLVLTGQKYSSEAARKELKAMLARLQDTQEHLVESEKMASLGGLVAGFAHELNTPLGIAITAESTLQRDLAKLSAAMGGATTPRALTDMLGRMQEASRIVLANAQRAGALIMSFKQVSVDQATSETRTINLHDYLADVLLHLAPNYRRSGHQVLLDCPPDISIRTVPGGISQVVINLLANSLIHAFTSDQKGHISLSVRQSSSGVVIRFSDDGIGIPEQDQKKIFEPFYTTRRSAGGTGLGLHIVYNTIIRQLQGRISVSSQPDQGTTFEISLPWTINDAEYQDSSPMAA
tara:strand:+ start:1411 stop:3792 length:2382 start_codon:yes stop_codon:yes gene_type:complete